MSRHRTVQCTILGGGLVVLLALLGCQSSPSPDELAQKALQADSPEEQQRAAADLAQVANNEELQPQVRKKAREQLRRVLGESQSMPVRVACLGGLSSAWDYESMPAFLDALDDKSDLIRSSAAATIERMMSVDLGTPVSRGGFGYQHHDPPQKRRPAIERVRKHWEEKRDSPIFIKWRERLKEKQS